MSLDEIEFRLVYNEACNAAEMIGGPDTKRAILLILQLVNAQREQIEEMQMQDNE